MNKALFPLGVTERRKQRVHSLETKLCPNFQLVAERIEIPYRIGITHVSVSCLFLLRSKNRLDEPEHVLRNDLVSFSIGVNAIRLHQFPMLVYVDQKKWHVGQMVLFGQLGKHRG